MSGNNQGSSSAHQPVAGEDYYGLLNVSREVTPGESLLCVVCVWCVVWCVLFYKRLPSFFVLFPTGSP